MFGFARELVSPLEPTVGSSRASTILTTHASNNPSNAGNVDAPCARGEQLNGCIGSAIHRIKSALHFIYRGCRDFITFIPRSEATIRHIRESITERECAFFIERQETELAKPKFEVFSFGGISPIPITIRTPNQVINTEVYLINANVHNTGIKTAEDARPFFYYSEKEPTGTKVCWALEDFGSTEIRTEENLDSDPEAISDFLRRKVLTKRSEDVQGGDVSPVVVAFVVKGSKSVYIPTTFRSAFLLPHAFEKPFIAVSMKDYLTKGIPLKDFAVLKFGEVGLKKEEEKSGP